MHAELLPPEGMTLEAAAGAISGVLTVRDRLHRTRDLSFYDTFDGLVRATGQAVVHEDGNLALLARANGAGSANGSGRAPGAGSATVALRRPARPLFTADLPAGALREALAPVIDVRALLPLVRVHSRERAIDVLDDEGKTVVRLTLSAPAAVAADRSLVLLRPRLALIAVRGYNAELERTRARLVAELGFAEAVDPLEDEAVRATGGTPGGTPSSVKVQLARGEPAARAVAAVLRLLLDVIEANLDGTIADVDTEFLHDLRVSVRRSRAVQRELKRTFPATELAHFRAEFRWLQAVTGPTRDLDVQVLGFGEFRALVGAGFAADLEPVLDVLRRHRRRAYLEMRRQLGSERTRALLTGWALLLGRMPEFGIDDGPEAERPIEMIAGARIAKVYGRMVRLGKAIGPDSPAADLHELRKQGKELRYLLELFGAPLYPAEVVKPLVRALKTLQDVLGRHQDRAVQVGKLRGLREEVAGRPHGAAGLIALGALAQSLLADEAAARGEFAERFATFASREQRRLVKETFP